MLPTQFLDVVLEEDYRNGSDSDGGDDDEENAWGSSYDEACPNNNNNNNNSMLEELGRRVPEALLSECTVELCTSTNLNKKAIPKLRFEARVIPIYNLSEPKRQKLQTNVTVGEVHDALTEVEAVYSDEDDGARAATAPPPPPQAYQCDHCDNAYSNRGALWQHSVATHSASKNCACSICGRTFYRNCSLALHLKSHAAQDDVGGATTAAQQQSTTTTQAQECAQGSDETSGGACKRPSAECSSSSATSRAGATAARPFECTFCNKCYSQKSVLKKHLVIHTGERLTCGVCGIDFTQKSSLLRHVKRMHSVAAAASGRPTAVLPYNVRIPSGISISMVD